MKEIKSRFSKVDYDALNSKQKEVHNFHYIAAVLAKHGYATYPIRDDWNGGDMIARHMLDSGKEMLTIQIKGRPTFDKKYQGKKIWIGFPHRVPGVSDVKAIYVYPHDEVLADYGKINHQRIEQTESWKAKGHYSMPSPAGDFLKLLDPYRLSAADVAVPQEESADEVLAHHGP